MYETDIKQLEFFLETETAAPENVRKAAASRLNYLRKKALKRGELEYQPLEWNTSDGA
jgi:hypothetical protein